MLQSTVAIRIPSIRKTTILGSICWLKKRGGKMSAKVPEKKRCWINTSSETFLCGPCLLNDDPECQSSWASSQKDHQKTSSLSFVAASQHRSIFSSPAISLNIWSRNARSGDWNCIGSLFAESAITPLDEREYLFVMSYPPGQLWIKCKCNSWKYPQLFSH